MSQVDSRTFRPGRFENMAIPPSVTMDTGVLVTMDTGVSPEVVAISLSALQLGGSPRLEGEDKAHIARLAAIETPLPPILIDRRSMQVIDGLHRFLAASLKGRATIDAKYFDGSPEDAFLLAVESNVTHGLPLSQADRRAAAKRIIESHPHMSDRAIAESAGLAAKTVAGIRHSTAAQQSTARVGRDGKIRPLSSVEGRRRAAEWIAQHPQASLRVIARAVGVSPATVADVRKRLEHGQESAPAGASAGRNGSDSAALAEAARPAPALVLEKLLRDPSLRYNDQGRRLLHWLRQNVVSPEERSSVIAAIPPHCAAQVAVLARQYAQMWLEFAQELDDRAKGISRPLRH
jgi:ParB-like chromosome segregation protein Spo0J